MSFSKQLLAHGKLILKSTFPNFVETWNWLVVAFDNLRGDGDLDHDNGFIQIDKSVPSNPVIRLINRDKLGGEITVVGTDENSVVCSSIRFESEDDSNITVRVVKAEGSNEAICKIGVYYA